MSAAFRGKGGKPDIRGRGTGSSSKEKKIVKRRKATFAISPRSNRRNAREKGIHSYETVSCGWGGKWPEGRKGKRRER